MEIEPRTPFSAELQQLLENRLFKRTLELYLYFKKKMPVDEIAEFTGRSTATIYRTISKWKSLGTIEEDIGRGRTSEYSSREEQKVITKQLNDRHKPSTAIFHEMHQEGSQISYGQVKHIISSHFTTIEGKRKIIISQENKIKRLLWIEKHQGWRKCKWENVFD